jgi:uncharacterized membrane protein YdcZ (DUF606 family)
MDNVELTYAQGRPSSAEDHVMETVDKWFKRTVIAAAIIVVGGFTAFGVARTIWIENHEAIVHWLASLDLWMGLEGAIMGGCGSLAVLAVIELFSKLNRIQRLLTEIRDQRRWP